MMKIVLAAFLISACATGSASSSGHIARRARPIFHTASAAPTRDPFPSAIDPRLPSVDRIARLVGVSPAAEVELCVSNDGRVAKVTLLQGSADELFDAALLRDVPKWEFIAAPSRTTLRMCKRATISYRAPS